MVEWLIVISVIYGVVVVFNLGYLVDWSFAPRDKGYYEITRFIDRYSYYNIVKVLGMMIFVLLTPIVMLGIFINWGFKRVK